MGLFPKDPRSVRPVHCLLFLGLVVIVLEIGASATVSVRHWWGGLSGEKGECVYQIFQDELCAATVFLQGPQTIPAILKAGGIRHRTDCSESVEEVPCGRRIVLTGQPPMPRIEKIPGRQLVAAGQRINVNSADETDLIAVPGIGPKTTRKIVEYREAHGPFSAVEELAKIPGIGSKKLHNWQKYLEATPSGLVRWSQDFQAPGALFDPAIRSQEDHVQHDPQIPH